MTAALLRVAGLLCLLAAPALWLRYGFHEFTAAGDLQLGGTLLLGVGLLEAGRLAEGLRAGSLSGYTPAESPRMYRWSAGLLAAGIAVLIGAGGFLALLPMVETIGRAAAP